MDPETVYMELPRSTRVQAFRWTDGEVIVLVDRSKFSTSREEADAVAATIDHLT
jgi:hypothetical protein